jgi:hypothetical protein
MQSDRPGSPSASPFRLEIVSIAIGFARSSIMSFGSARIRGRSGHTASTASCGTAIAMPIWKSGRPITGATYVRQQGGPQARPLQPMLTELEKDGVIARRLAERSGEFDLLFAIRRPDLSHFRADEISVVEAVTRVVCLDSRGSIAHQAAHDRVWQSAQIGEVLPYFTVFAGRPGDILAADIDWAMRRLHPREGGAPAARNEPLEVAGADSADRHREALDAALWHLNRDPSIGISLPATRASWFIYKQAGLSHLAVPDVVVVYGFDMDEFLLEAVRLGSADDDIEGDG